MASSYQYQPLSSPSTQIRILELLPGRRGIIHCRLKVADLEEAKGTYEPISYCWKASTRKHWWGATYKEKKKQKTFRIRIDGADFCVTESLLSALCQMRLRTEVRVLWADAICINQADDNEKGAQVAIMGQIYQSGKQTLAWLGNANCWTGIAFRHLRKVLHEVSEESGSHETSEESTGDMKHSSEDLGARCLRHVRRLWGLWQTVLRFLAYRSVLNRPYFERAWVVQEVVLSNDVVVICGKHKITRDEMYQACNELLQRRHGIIPQATWIKRSFGDLWDNRELYCLDKIICELLHMKTSDPRDKLYSVLGLHQDCEDCGSMVVDYSKDVDEVFLSATKLILSRSPFLDLLSTSYGISQPDGKRAQDGEYVPSWVWNPEPRFISSHFSQTNTHAPWWFQASQGWHSKPQFQGRMLGLLGYEIGNVKTIGKAFPAHPNTAHLSPKIVFEVLECYFSWINVSGIYERGITEAEQRKRLNAFRCTLKPFKELYNRAGIWYSSWFDDKDRRNFDSFHAEICKRFCKFFPPEVKKLSVLGRLRLWVAIMAFSASLNLPNQVGRPFIEAGYSTTVFNQRFVRTESGCYGLCHHDTMPNDRLVLLQGANVPIILRPSGKNWVLVGECFLYGAMYGELWDQNRCNMLWIE